MIEGAANLRIEGVPEGLIAIVVFMAGAIYLRRAFAGLSFPTFAGRHWAVRYLNGVLFALQEIIRMAPSVALVLGALALMGLGITTVIEQADRVYPNLLSILLWLLMFVAVLYIATAVARPLKREDKT